MQSNAGTGCAKHNPNRGVDGWTATEGHQRFWDIIHALPSLFGFYTVSLPTRRDSDTRTSFIP